MDFLDSARKVAEKLAASKAGLALLNLILRKATGVDLEQIGSVKSMELDLRGGKLQALLDLKGDPTLLAIDELLFKVIKTGETSQLEILSIRTDRDWINTLAGLSLPATMELDPSVASVLSLLI